MVNRYVKFTLICFLSILTALCSQIKFYIGFIPYTFQNFAVILSGLIVGRYGFLPQLLYLAMIALGFPASARGGGLGVLFGYTSGYLWMFPVSALIMGIAREKVWREGSNVELLTLWFASILAVIPIYLLGFYVFWIWASGDGIDWCMRVVENFGFRMDEFWAVFFATVVVFVPQDLLMDHTLSLIVFRYVQRILRERGYDLP